ncbi:hypothetical protein BO94DRAFT_455823 [Aspergillus sclerotioniger CBS 115572]|uniref:Uncharacterized protein n=1 Tax=Aspergillus sclerotioniger CBS 115572 TaxID=1450535 RepID=A0A317XE53_9EURO|nr:hypothetical protein BO94DRAFT_455823 [Aspergillus sclerotioniger CBS 115572]PWY96032.1 hypothetical protein BO94DRAFT_455823 [Aspergillus sclerotioniger CBS 115572]
MNPAFSQPLYSISEEITPIDDYIRRHGGTSSNIERLPSRLQQSKRSSIDLKQQLKDLTYEVSYLKAELQWHKESKQALLEFKEQVSEIFHRIEDALVQATIRLTEAEQRYLNLWGLNTGGDMDGLNMI